MRERESYGDKGDKTDTEKGREVGRGGKERDREGGGGGGGGGGSGALTYEVTWHFVLTSHLPPVTPEAKSVGGRIMIVASRLTVQQQSVSLSYPPSVLRTS